MASGTITTNTDTTYFTSQQQQSNANARLHLSGTWDGATVQVKVSRRGEADYKTISGGAYTASADPIINLPISGDIILTSTGVGGSTSIVWELT
jgi:hypothetical protein